VEKQLGSLNFEGLALAYMPSGRREQGRHNEHEWWVMYNPDLPKEYAVTPRITLKCNFQTTCLCFFWDQKHLAVGVRDGFKLFSIVDQLWSETVPNTLP
jgi:hypothetical protein